MKAFFMKKGVIIVRSFLMRFPGGKEKAVTFSYDDGVCQDKRLAEIFDKYGMKATFNFTSWSDYSAEEIEEYFLSKGHEIAVHGMLHRATGNIRPIEGIREVLELRMLLEKKCGQIIRGMAYPDSGITRFSNFTNYDMIKQYLTELDIAYSRTLGGDNKSFELPMDFHAWMPTAHHDNPEILNYIDEFFALDFDKLYYPHRTPRLFYIWGHSYEFDKKNNWEHIEKICEKFAEHDEVWRATNIEIYDYVESYKALRRSADGTMVQNPTNQTVWFDVDGKLYSVNPGETITVSE